MRDCAAVGPPRSTVTSFELRTPEERRAEFKRAELRQRQSQTQGSNRGSRSKVNKKKQKRKTGKRSYFIIDFWLNSHTNKLMSKSSPW